MPRLLTSPRQGRRKTPPCGRVIEYNVPHSPFQKLVDGRIKAKGWSYREAARALTDLGARTSHSTLWIWLHCQAGYPAPRNFTDRHLHALAELLAIPVPQLREAFDASRHVFTPKENPVPQASRDALEVALAIFRHDRRKVVRTTHVVSVLERLKAGLPPQ